MQRKERVRKIRLDWEQRMPKREVFRQGQEETDKKREKQKGAKKEREQEARTENKKKNEKIG